MLGLWAAWAASKLSEPPTLRKLARETAAASASASASAAAPISSARTDRRRLDVHAVLRADARNSLHVGRTFRRRRKPRSLGRLARLGEELVDPAGRVRHEQARLLGRLEVLDRSRGDVEERSGTTLDRLT